MKTITLKSLLVVIAGMLYITGISAQNKEIKSIVKHYIPSMAPYKYDSYAIKKIVYGSNEKREVFEFAIYSDEEYKLVFCKTEFSQSIDINIYDRDPKLKGRKLIYFDESEKKASYVCSFRPPKIGTYYIECKIPPATAPDQQGYIVLLIGIKENNRSLAAK